MKFDDLPLDGPADMDEWGKIETHNLIDCVDASAVNTEISSVHKIILENKFLIGLALIGRDGPELCIWNFGDELHYGSFASLIAQDWDMEPPVCEAEVVSG